MKSNVVKRIMIVLMTVFLLGSLAGCVELESEPGKEDYEAVSSQGEKKEEQSFSLNETAVFKSLKITATEIKESSGESFFSPDDGKVYVGVKFVIENISDEEQTVSSLLLFDAYVDDVACDLSFTASAAFGSETVDGTIAAGKKLVGWYAMEVPSEWSSIELHVKSNWLSNATAKFVFGK